MVLLLVIIYLSIIGLGLPDSLLGSAWPTMYGALGASVSSAGIAAMIVSGGMIISSLLSYRAIRRFGTGPVTTASMAMTATALLGISCAGNFAVLCLCAVPLGLGAGSMDAALNSFVAMHYQAAHINWLHSFWGMGASMSPMIMAHFLSRTGGGMWRSGYRAVAAMQLVLAVVLAASLPLWKRIGDGGGAEGEGERAPQPGILRLLKLPRARPTLLAFFCYCAVESGVGLWGGTYMVMARGLSGDAAARRVSLYFLGITLGRGISGFLALRMSQRNMIRLGLGVTGAGIAWVAMLPAGVIAFGLFLVGLGCAPIFPNLIRETPRHFGRENSQAIVGVQMACAYMGSTFMPPLFGVVGSLLGYGLFPVYMAVFWAAMTGMAILVYRGVPNEHES